MTNRRIAAARSTAFVVALATVLTASSGQSAALLSKTAELGIPSQRSRAIAVSPDGSNVYVAVDMRSWPYTSAWEARLVAFHRDPAGGLDEMQSLENGAGGITALEAPELIRVSPDGETVVVASGTNDSLVVFDRDPATGLLSFSAELVEGVGGVDGLDGVVEVTFSPDSAHLYVAAKEEDGITGFAHDSATSALAMIEKKSTWDNPNSVSISPDGLHIYTDTSSFTRDPATGELTLLEERYHLTGPARVSPNGLWVYQIARYLSHAYLVVLARDPATGLVAESSARRLADGGDGYLTPLTFHPSENYAYYAYRRPESPSESVLYRGVIDPATGLISEADDIGLPPSTGVAGLAIAADGSSLFMVGDHHEHAVEYAIDLSGHISLRAVGFSGPFQSGAPREAVVSSDDRYIYLAASSYFSEGSVTVWSRDPVSGDLTYVDGETSVAGQFSGLTKPEALALSPDGAHLYVAASGSGAVAWLYRSAATGEIDPGGMVQDDTFGVDGIGGIYDVAVSPDGRHVYATGTSDNAIAAFSRDAGTGALTFIGAEFDGQAGVEGLWAPADIAISPDGRHVYVAASGLSLPHGKIARFTRDETSGELTFAEGLGGVEGLLYHQMDLVMSDDGSSVYVLSECRYPCLVADWGRTIAEFSRDAATGTLTFREAHIDGLGGVYGLDAPLLLSADGLYAYAGEAVFARNPTTGSLSFIEKIDDHHAARLHLASSDGKHVYVLNARSNSRSRWEHGFSGCEPAPVAGCKLAQKTSLSLRDHENPARQKLTWSYVNGEPTTIESFDTDGGNHYGFCLYDESGPSPTLVMEILLPAHGDCRRNYAGLEKPCWSKTRRLKYADPFYTPDGVNSVLLQPSQLQKTKIKLKGKGSRLPIEGLPLGLPVRAQLQNKAGACWEATYGMPRKNDSTTFKAKR